MDRARILVVEDERIVAADIEYCLTQLGHVVVGSAASGKEAIRIAIETRPDLVLMDIMLEGAQDGIATAVQLRSELNLSVIYLTAYSDEEIIQRAKLTEPLGYVHKPFEEVPLSITIEMALHRQGLEREREQLRVNLENAVHTIKRLSGLLPICATCKKIRDEGGKWLQLETYITLHSDAYFSHGICPDCFAEVGRREGW